jgi:predicted nucleic acid-binding protein
VTVSLIAGTSASVGTGPGRGYPRRADSPRAISSRSRSREQPRRSGSGLPDLLIAATAELAGLAVLHHDEDFDIIADVTGQRLERLQLDE